MLYIVIFFDFIFFIVHVVYCHVFYCRVFFYFVIFFIVILKINTALTHPTVSPSADNWWCAQKRPLAALVDYFDNLNGNLRDTLPDFLLVIDDDTFVNSVLFHEFLNWLPNPERNSIYLGDTLPGSGDSFVAGGGGWLVSKKILQSLSTQKNGDFNAYICLNKQQQASGSWCWYHSDWAIGECIFKFTNAIPVHTNYFIQDSNNCVDRENLNKEIGINYDHCRKCDLMSSITCHKYNSEEQLTMHRSTMKKHRLKQT